MWQSDYPAAATAAVVTVKANDDTRNENKQILRIDWSYSATPTNGNLKVEVDGLIIWQIDISSGGPDFVSFDVEERITSKRGIDIVVTLASGGGTCVGKLNVKTGER